MLINSQRIPKSPAAFLKSVTPMFPAHYKVSFRATDFMTKLP